MYFYNANKSHLNKHPSIDKASADFVKNKSLQLDGFTEAGRVCKLRTEHTYEGCQDNYITAQTYNKESVFFSIVAYYKLQPLLYVIV